MSSQKLTALEQAVLTDLAEKAGIAAVLLETWADLPADSEQSARTLVNAAQLGVTEEGATHAILEQLVGLGLVEITSKGFRPRSHTFKEFRRFSMALHVVEYYRSFIHQDATVARVVLTKPPKPSILEQKLSALGWRTADLEPTKHAFHSLVQAAKRRLVIMTPFFDYVGAVWLREVLSLASPNVERVLILRSLEDPTRKDYPLGIETIFPWLNLSGVQVFNYSIPRTDGGRETFHAKVVLCDRNAAYLGSSNVTAASLEHSMEMGVVLEGRAAANIAEVIDAVIAAAHQFN